MLYLTIFLFFLNIQVTMNQSTIQRYVERIDRKAIVSMEGYKNVGNRGPYKGCCGEINLTICQPCKYKIEALLHYETFYGKPTIKRYQMGIYPEYSQGLWGFYSTEIFYAYNKWKYIYITMTNVDNPSSQIDRTPYIYVWAVGFNYWSDIHGINNFIKFWATIKIEALGKHDHYAYLNIIIQSIHWNNYRLSNQKCCSRLTDDLCSTPCDYYFTASFINTWTYSENSEEIRAFNDDRDKQLALLITFSNVHRDPITWIQISIKEASRYSQIDSIRIQNLKGKTSGYVTDINNLVGAYGNVAINLSYWFECNRYVGDYCNKECSVLAGSEYCNNATAAQKCNNGASDDNLCENTDEVCQEDTCNNAGRCTRENNKKICYCDEGHYGRFCQYSRCINNCHGNGYCIGPNKCKCYDTINVKGEFCDEYWCGNSKENPCGSYGKCFYKNSTIKCYCDYPFVIGQYCDSFLCDVKCISGKCEYIPELNRTKCVCYAEYSGESCDQRVSQESLKQAEFNLIGVLTGLVIAMIISIIIVVLLHLKIININLSYSGSETTNGNLDSEL